METGFRGTFVISWSQTEVEGLDNAPVHSLDVGAVWSWHGDVVRVDGRADVLQLDGANGSENLRKRAARMVHCLVGAAVENKPLTPVIESDEPLMDRSFVVTDGVQAYTVTLIDVDTGSRPLLMFMDQIPPRNRNLWIVQHTLNAAATNAMAPAGSGVICFTPGTRIETPNGPRLIQDLREGDKVQTKDNGAQDILWIGSRRLTGARLFAMPHLRPIRIKAGALGVERPDEELLVSPDHRMIIKGDKARDLFNTSEVLVSAKDLLNGTSITVDVHVPQVTYVHLLLPDHQVLWANGIETESFHPANASLKMLEESDRARLLEQFPDLEFDPHTYGDYARRNLSMSEAAILGHAA